MVGRGSGVSQEKHAHPSCFASGMLVDYAPTGAAKCKVDGSSIAKGEVRLRLRLLFIEGCCDDMVGQAKEQQIYKVANAGALVRKYLALEGVAVTPASIPGLEELDCDEHRRWVVEALEGRAVATPPPRRTVEAPKAKPKKKRSEAQGGGGATGEGEPAAKGSPKAKRKRTAAPPPPQVVEEEEEESEAEVAD